MQNNQIKYQYQQSLLIKMNNAQQQGNRSKSLKDSIYQTINFTKFQSVANLLRNSRKRQAQYHPFSSQHSFQRNQLHSPNINTDLSAPRYTPSPPSRSHSRSAPHRSTDQLGHPMPIVNNKNSKPRGKQKLPKKQSFLMSQKRGDSKKKKNGGTKNDNVSRGSERVSRRRDKVIRLDSKDKEKGSSRLNLSSILQQESSESKLMTPSDRGSKLSKRKFSGEQTRKKQRNGIREVVWRRLERSLTEPEKFHRLLRNESISVRFRVLRRKLIQIQVIVEKEVSSLNIILQKGNLDCQGIQELFPKLQSGSIFSLYASIRGIDLSEPVRLPKLQIQANLSFQHRFEKVITLPYCWLHLVDESMSHQLQRSRIRTKTCLQQMNCSRSSLRLLHGVLPGWQMQSTSRIQRVWESRFSVGECEFEFQVKEREGHFGAQLTGRGQQRMTRMLQFLCGLLC